MSGEPGARAVDRESSLRAMLAELGETLERLRERLAEAERPGAERDEHALAIFQEVLSVPPLGLPPGELFALAVDRLSRLLAADRAVLFVLDEASGRLVPRSVRGLRREELEPLAIEPGEGLIGRVFREKRVLIHDAAAPESADPFAERFPVRQGIAVPVRTEGEIGGVLFAGRGAAGHAHCGARRGRCTRHEHANDRCRCLRGLPRRGLPRHRALAQSGRSYGDN